MSPHKQDGDMSCYFFLFCILESVATIGVYCVEFFLSMKFQNGHVDKKRHKVLSSELVKYQFWGNYPFKYQYVFPSAHICIA